jgi:hypothetical protein
MYDDGMEIMIPAHIDSTEAILAEQYLWISKDKKTIISVARGLDDLETEDIENRLSEYYRVFRRDIKDFKCKLLKKRSINLKPYGEIRYYSKMMGYNFFNMFYLGAYEGREVIFTIQCIESEMKSNLHIFEIIADSLRIKRKRSNNVMEGGRYAH